VTALFVSAVAEPVEVRKAAMEGQHVLRMGDGSLQFTITPDTARQWIGALEPIAKER